MLVLLLLLRLLSFGVLTPWLGFYWDDWYSVWTFHALGPSGLVAGFAVDRPGLGWLYATLAPLLGQSPFPWHVLAVVALWLGSFAFWWSLRGVWPDQPRAVACAAILFAVYPGFTQQSISWAYVHTWIQQAIFFASLGAMVWALRLPRYFWLLTALAIVGSVLEVQFTEYFMGLELFRFALLWQVLHDSPGGSGRGLRRSLALGLPYVLVVGSSVLLHLWLLEDVTFSNRQLGVILQTIYAHPVGELTRRLGYVASDLLKANGIAWARIIQPDVLASTGLAGWASWGFGLVGGVAVALYLSRAKFSPQRLAVGPGAAAHSWERRAVFLGLLAVVAGLLPIWLSDRHIEWAEALDRHSIPAAPGAALLLVGVLFWALRPRFRFVAAFSLLVGLAVGFQFRQANAYRQDWARAKALAWQLSWRLPGLEPGTTVFLHQAPWPLPQAKDYTFAIPLNLIYGPGQQHSQADYWVFTDAVPYRWYWLQLRASAHGNVVLERVVRNVSFSAPAADSLVMSFDWPNCLRVLDPKRDELPHLPLLVRGAQPFSNLGRIRLQQNPPAQPPAAIFGVEPQHDWCYLYEKADLARQRGDWSEVARLGDEARQGHGLGPQLDRTEWLPFIEGYVHLGRYAEARELAELMRYNDDWATWRQNFPDQVAGSQLALCRLWDRLQHDPSLGPAQSAFIAEAQAQPACSPG